MASPAHLHRHGQEVVEVLGYQIVGQGLLIPALGVGDPPLPLEIPDGLDLGPDDRRVFVQFQQSKLS